jgi:RND family efflux transporter MFP subunit
VSHAKTRVRRWVEIGAAAAVLVVILLWSEGMFRRKVGPGGEEGVAGTGVAGPVAEVALADLPVVLEAVGTVRGIEEAVLSARVTGVIDRIAVRAGDRVRKGEVLAVFTAPELAAQQAAAQGAVRAAEAAVAQAESDWKRADYLFQREAATRVEWERARSALEQARGGLVQTRGAAGAAASLAAYSELRAPFDGLVTERNRDPGDLASPGVPILRVVDDRLFRLEAAIDEREAEHARRASASR